MEIGKELQRQSLVLRDLARLMPAGTRLRAEGLDDTWNTHWQDLGQDDEQAAAAINDLRTDVTAALDGFNPATRTNVLVELNARMRIDLSLSVGTLTESVEVTAEVAPAVSTAPAATARRRSAANVRRVRVSASMGQWRGGCRAAC